MARIRTIKPEFPQSESIGRLSRDARLLFVQLWTICDDHGRCRGAIRLLAGQLYPYDDDAVAGLEGWLQELVRGGLVLIYQVDGSTYLQVLAWEKHQRVDNAGRSLLPAPPRPSEQPEARSDNGSPRVAAVRREPPRTSASCGGSRLDLGPRTIGPRTSTEAREDAREPCSVEPDKPAASEAEPEPEKPEPAKPGKRRPVERPTGVPEQLWSDWIAHRRRKRAEVSATAVAGIAAEAEKAGMTLADALAHSIAQGWQGFRAEWMYAARAGPARGRAPVVPTSTNHEYWQDSHGPL